MQSTALRLSVAALLVAGLVACGSDDSSAVGGSGAAAGSASGGAAGSSTTTGVGGAGAGGSGVAGGSAGTGGSSAGGQGQGGSPGSVGCGKSSPTGVQPSSIDVGAATRTFVLSVPVGYDPLTPLALVFAWHGRGGSGAGARSYFGVEQQAGAAAIFVYPDGLPIDGGDTGWDLQPTGLDVALYDALRARIEADYCVDRSRVFSTGHSFGGYMTNTVGCARAGELRGIAPVAGGGPWGGCDTTALSAFVVHGSNDTVVDPAQGQASLEYWRAQAACSAASQPIEPAGCVEYSGCSAARIVFCSHDEGHAWPALAPAGVWGFFASL